MTNTQRLRKSKLELNGTGVGAHYPALFVQGTLYVYLIDKSETQSYNREAHFKEMKRVIGGLTGLPDNQMAIGTIEGFSERDETFNFRFTDLSVNFNIPIERLVTW